MTPPLRAAAARCLRLTALLALAALIAACASRAKPQQLPVPAAHEERGVASWYGAKHHGKRTASGEIYDMDRLTAAHPSLPFGTVVEVTNLENGRRVEVRVNDRGPFGRGRIIDLSRAAARELGMIARGVARVKIHVLRRGVKS